MSDPAPAPVPATAVELGLAAHPEGGWFRQTWSAHQTVTLADGRVRPTATLIWFLLAAGESSAWHRVSSEELWLAVDGTVELELGGDGPHPRDGVRRLLGRAPGQEAEVLVEAGTWQRTVPGDLDALVRCLVSPGFDFADFELA